MYGIDMKKTGQRIKELCKSRNVSVKEIRQKLFIGSFQAIYAWFSGKSLPSLDNLYRLSRLLKVPMDEIIVGEQEDVRDLIYKTYGREASARILLYYKKLVKEAA